MKGSEGKVAEKVTEHLASRSRGEHLAKAEVPSPHPRALGATALGSHFWFEIFVAKIFSSGVFILPVNKTAPSFSVMVTAVIREKSFWINWSVSLA